MKLPIFYENNVSENCKPIFNLDDHEIPGVPDGMTIDTDGNLWVAVFDGGCLLHVNPNTSELIERIEFPVKQVGHFRAPQRNCAEILGFQVTAAAFGGPNMDVLYVTTAQLVVDGVEQPDPAGAVFAVTGTGAKGYPNYKVKLEA